MLLPVLFVLNVEGQQQHSRLLIIVPSKMCPHGTFNKLKTRLEVCRSHRLDVEGLVDGFHLVTMAELGGRRAGRAIVQHQRPGGSVIVSLSYKTVVISATHNDHQCTN